MLNTENKFDNLGRAVKSVYDLHKLGEKMTYTVTYKGNADIQSGRIASFTLPSNHSISYNYDAFERLTQKQLFIGTGAIPTEKFGYYTANNKTVNLVTSHTINVNNYMNNPQSQVIYNYTYDNYGNILTVNEGATLKLSYTYDDLNQLTRENNAYANKTYVYTYDKNGNILTKKTYAYTTGTLGTVQSTINYTYGNSSWKDLLTNYNGTTISYDGVGNPTNWRGNLNTLTWTGRELTGITMPSSQTMSYKYNSDGIRTQKTFTDNAVKYLYKHDYILDGANIVAETITYTTYMGTNTTEVLYFYYDESGSPTGMKYNGNVYFFQKNLQGDIIRILNTQGSIVATYTYDAWGNIIASTDTSGVSIGTKNPFRYRGYYYDTETGLYYLNSRYYDPQVGRFLNADAYASTGQGLLGSNMFAYCLNNPICLSDYIGNAPHSALEREAETNYTPIPDYIRPFRVAIIYDSRDSGRLFGLRGGEGFEMQADWLKDMYRHGGKAVYMYPYHDMTSFVEQWNSIKESDFLIVIGHGVPEELHCAGQMLGVSDTNLDHYYSELKNVKTNGVLLLACNGATIGNSGTSTAHVLSQKTNAPVIAVKDGKVSYFLFTGFPRADEGGVWVVIDCEGGCK